MSNFKRVLLMTWLMSAAGLVTAAAAQTAGEQTMAQTDDGGFDDWGLLGLLGLAGLLGRKRDRGVETRRV